MDEWIAKNCKGGVWSASIPHLRLSESITVQALQIRLNNMMTYYGIPKPKYRRDWVCTLDVDAVRDVAPQLLEPSPLENIKERSSAFGELLEMRPAIQASLQNRERLCMSAEDAACFALRANNPRDVRKAHRVFSEVPLLPHPDLSILEIARNDRLNSWTLPLSDEVVARIRRGAMLPA